MKVIPDEIYPVQKRKVGIIFSDDNVIHMHTDVDTADLFNDYGRVVTDTTGSMTKRIFTLDTRYDMSDVIALIDHLNNTG